jgi:hypothetical protein
MLQSEAYVTPEHRQSALQVAVDNVDTELARRTAALSETLFPYGRQPTRENFSRQRTGTVRRRRSEARSR